ncbi:MAG: hypothetical protein ACRC28_11215 [Clostridium sp.]|uniref:hypothetical protein n=1 Tax=Clostridium sp. TaxID=1506 RepID=UPI003F3BB762
MIKKRNGSSMITILGVTLVLVLLSGIILSLTMGTMKSNTNQKVIEDLRYAAESGLEVGRSRMSEKPIISGTPGSEIVTFPSIDTRTAPDDVLVQSLKKGMIGNVEVVSTTTDADKFITITSIATHKDDPSKKAEVKCRYIKNKNGVGTVFDYGLVAGQNDIDIKINDELKMGSSPISKPDGDKVLVNNSEYDNGKVTNNSFESLKIVNNMKKSKKVIMKGVPAATEYSSFGYYTDSVEEKNKINKMEIKVDISKPSIAEIDGVGNLQIEEIRGKEKPEVVRILFHEGGNIVIDILLVNSEKLDIELDTGNSHLYKKAILCSGEVEIRSSTGGLSMDSSTIFGDKVSINMTGAINITFASGDESFGMNSEKEKIINGALKLLIENWDEGTGLEKNWMSMDKGSFDN